MGIELPSVIQNACDLFREFEWSKDHNKRVKIFKSAINIVNKYIERNPDTPHFKIIMNLKKSYLRKLIEQLSDDFGLPLPEVEWFDYLIIILNEKETLDYLLEKDTHLKSIWDGFLESWKDDINYLIARFNKQQNQQSY